MKWLLGKQAGFTLVELLVVVGIMLALAAAIIPNIARFTKSGETAGASSELSSIQAALDTAIAERGLSTAIARTGVSDFSSTGGAFIQDPDGIPGNGDEIYLYPNFLRLKDAGYGPYSWDVTGLVSK